MILILILKIKINKFIYMINNSFNNNYNNIDNFCNWDCSSNEIIIVKVVLNNNKNINIVVGEEDNEKDIENKINEIFNSNNIIENQRENYKKEIYNQIKFQINQRKLFYLIYIINIL